MSAVFHPTVGSASRRCNRCSMTPELGLAVESPQLQTDETSSSNETSLDTRGLRCESLSLSSLIRFQNIPENVHQPSSVSQEAVGPKFTNSHFRRGSVTVFREVSQNIASSDSRLPGRFILQSKFLQCSDILRHEMCASRRRGSSVGTVWSRDN